MFIKKTTTIKLISAVLINAFLLLDFAWASGASFDVSSEASTLSPIVQISQDYFLAEFKQKSLAEEIVPIESFPVKTQDLPDSTEYVDKAQDFKGISIEHFIVAQYFLAKQDISAVLANLNIVPSQDEQLNRLQVYKVLCSEGYSKQIIDLLNQDNYENPRLNLDILSQNTDARSQSIYEAVSNSLDALGLDIGQLGKGVKQILAWLESSGIDKVEVFTKTRQGLPHKLTILKDEHDQLFIQINQISPDVYHSACSDQQEHGTIVKLSVANRIPENIQESGDSGLNSLEEIKAGIHRRFAYITSVEVTTQINKGTVEIVNNFNTKEIIVPEKHRGKLISDTQGRKVSIQLNSNSITISDNGKGMDARTLSNMFVPVIGGTKNSHVLSPQEVQEELDKITVIQDRTLDSCVSFSRNGEVIDFFDIKNNFQSDSTIQGGICIEAGKLFEVDESRDLIRMSVSSNKAKKSNFQLAIERAVESLLEHKQLTDQEKIKYINSLVIGLDGIAGSNEHYQYVAKTLRMQIKKLLQEKKIIERLKRDNYIILPHDKVYSKLAIPEGKKALYMHEQLFDWKGAISLEAMGGVIIPQVTIDQDKKLPLVILPFSEEYISKIKTFDQDWHTWPQQDILPIIENGRFIAVASQLAGNRLIELINQKISAQGLSKTEEDELLFILQGINILTAKEVFTSYEVLKSRKNLMFENIQLKTSSGKIYSDAVNAFLSKPPLVDMSNSELNSENQMPEDANQKYMVLANNDLVDISDGKVIMHNIESIETLSYGGYKLKSKKAGSLFFSWADYKMDAKDDDFITITDRKTGQVCYKGFGLRVGDVPGLTIHPFEAEAIFNDPRDGDPKYVVDSVGGELKLSPTGRFAYMQLHSTASEKEVDIEIYDLLENKSCSLAAELAPRDRKSIRIHQDILQKEKIYFINLQFSSDDKYLIFEQASRDYKFMSALSTARDDTAVNLKELLPISNCQTALNPFALVVYIQDKDNKIRLFDLKSMQLINSVPVAQLHTDSSGSYTVLVNNYEDKNITVYDYATKKSYTTLPSGEKITGAQTIYQDNGEFKFTVFNSESNSHYLINQAGELVFSPTFNTLSNGFIYETITSKAAVFINHGVVEMLKFTNLSPEQKLKNRLIYKHPYAHIVCNETKKTDGFKMIAIAADATVKNSFSAIGEDGDLILLFHNRPEGVEETRILNDVCIDNLEKPQYIITTIENSSDKDKFVLLEVLSNKITETETTLSKQEYDAVQWDGTYFVFTNAQKGRAAYLNPENPKQVYQVQVPKTFNPNLENIADPLENISASKVPEKAKQRFSLLANGDVIAAGSDRIVDQGIGELTYLSNGYYKLLRKANPHLNIDKEVYQVVNYDTGKKSLSLPKESWKVRLSPDKRFTFFEGSIDGKKSHRQMIELIDLKSGQYIFWDQELFDSAKIEQDSEVPNISQVEFTADGKYITYLLASKGRQTQFCIQALPQGNDDLDDSLFNCRINVGKGGIAFRTSPFANVAYLENKTEKSLCLIDIETGAIIASDARRLRTASNGIYTIIKTKKNKMHVYHHKSHKLLAAFPGESPIDVGMVETRYLEDGTRKIYLVFKEASGVVAFGAMDEQTGAFSRMIIDGNLDIKFNEFQGPGIYGMNILDSGSQIISHELDHVLSEHNLRGIYKHPEYNMLIDEYKDMVYLLDSNQIIDVTDDSGGLLYSNAEIVFYKNNQVYLKKAGEIFEIFHNGSKWQKEILKNAVIYEYKGHKFLLEKLTDHYQIDFENDNRANSLAIKGIDPLEYSKVDYDGEYLIFTDLQSGAMVYINPIAVENPVFVPVVKQESLQSGEIPNNAQQIYTLLDNGDIVKIGTEEKIDSNVKSCEYLQNGYYLIEKNDGSLDFRRLAQATISAPPVFHFKKDTNIKIKYSPDKRFVYTQYKDKGIASIMFDCKFGEYYDASTMMCFSESEAIFYDKRKQAVDFSRLRNGGILKQKIIWDLQFSNDNKKMLFKLSENGKNYLVILKIADELIEDYSFSDPITKMAFNSSDMAFDQFFQERLESGSAKVEYLPHDFDFKSHPLANVVYIQSKSSKNMILFNLARQEIMSPGEEPIEFMHTDSAGIYTMIYYRNGGKAIYHHHSGELIRALPDGSEPDYVQTVYDGQTIRVLCANKDPNLESRSWFELKQWGGFDEKYGSWSANVATIISEVQTNKQLHWANNEFTKIWDADLNNIDSLSEENLNQYNMDQTYYLLVVNDPSLARIIIPETGRQFSASLLAKEVLFYNQDTATIFVRGNSTKKAKDAFVRHINNKYTDSECALDNNKPHKFMVGLIPVSDGDSEYRLFSFEKKYMPSSNLGMLLFGISSKKYTQVSFDGKYFIFIDQKTGDAVYLDPAHPEAKRFVLGNKHGISIDDEQLYEKKKKIYDAWKQKVLISRDQFLAQAESMIELFIKKIPIEFRLDIETKIKSSIDRLYEKQDCEIRQRFDDFMNKTKDFDIEQPLPFDVFSQRIELFEQQIKGFIENQQLRLAQEEFASQRMFYENLFSNLFALCWDDNIQIKASPQTIIQAAAYGWDITSQGKLNMVDDIEQLILGLSEATDEQIEIAQIMKIISFLNYAASKTGTDSAEIVQHQLDKLFAKNQLVKQKFLESLWRSFRDIEFKTLKAAVDYPDKAHELDKARAFIAFFSSEIDDLKIKQRFIPKGKQEKMPEGGVFISQIVQLEKMRAKKIIKNKKDSPMDMEYFLENINNLPTEDESLESEIRRYTTVQREAGAHTGETAQNSRDATKGTNGKLVVDFYLQIGFDGKEEYVEQATDNGTGALKEVALLIPKSTKAEGQQIDLTGFFGTGKYTIFEDVDRVEIITKNDDQAYMFTYQVTAQGVKLVDIIEVHDQQVQQGVTVRRIKAVENCMPELEQMLSIRAWKTFAGLAQNDNFKIYIVDSQGIERPLKVDAEKLSETDFIAVKPGEARSTNFGKMRIWSAKDMPLQLIDSAGFRIKDIDKQEYLKLVPQSLRRHVDELRMIIQIPLPLIRNRSGFENEPRYLPIIQKYVAIEIYKAIAYKTLSSTASGQHFTFENFPLDWERETGYWDAIDFSDQDIVRLAQQIDDAEYGLIDNAKLRDLLPKKDLMDFDKKFLKLILLLEVILDWKTPKVRRSLFLRRRAIQELIDAEKAKASQALLESMGKKIAIVTPNMEDMIIFQDMVMDEIQKKVEEEKEPDIKQLIVPPEEYSAFEARFVLLANHIVKYFGLDTVDIVRSGVSFAGLIQADNNGTTLYLNRDIIGAEVLGRYSSDYVLNDAIDSLIHELSHYLVDYLINYKGKVSLEKGFSAHKVSFSHESVGNFAAGMKYVAAIVLANHKPFSELVTACPPNNQLRLDDSISSLIAQAI